MSGGQRQGIAICRAVTWASKVVFMDEPTAALGVVQTRNVLEQIQRVREQGLSVVLISHNMPEVFEVADRIEVLRLGERVARLRPSDVSMEDVVSAMTGALTFHEEDGVDDRRPQIEPEVEERRGAADAAWQRAASRARATPIGLILVGLIVVFSVLEPDEFSSVANARNIATDAAVLLVIATGLTYVIITAGIDLSVGSVLVFSGVVAAKLMNAGRRQQLGRHPGRARRRARRRARLGAAQRLPGRQGEDPAVHRHARHARHGARRSRC